MICDKLGFIGMMEGLKSINIIIVVRIVIVLLYGLRKSLIKE